VPPPREAAPPGEAVDPQHLVGLSEDDIRRVIGVPAGVREQSPAVVWSYASAACALDVFFYLDLASQTFRAVTYQLTPKGAQGLQGGACLASLRTGTHD
jgi:hypothetical protein